MPEGEHPAREARKVRRARRWAVLAQCSALRIAFPAREAPGTCRHARGGPVARTRINANNKREQYCKLSLGRTWHFFAFLLLIFCFSFLLPPTFRLRFCFSRRRRGASWSGVEARTGAINAITILDAKTRRRRSETQVVARPPARPLDFHRSDSVRAVPLPPSSSFHKQITRGAHNTQHTAQSTQPASQPARDELPFFPLFQYRQVKVSQTRPNQARPDHDNSSRTAAEQGRTGRDGTGQDRSDRT